VSRLVIFTRFSDFLQSYVFQEHSIANSVSSNFSAGVWDNNCSPKCISQPFVIHVTSSLGAITGCTWLTVLDGKEPTQVFDK